MPRLESRIPSLVVLRNLVVRNRRVQYQRSFLGFLWTLLNPLGTVVTLIIVFGSRMHWMFGRVRLGLIWLKEMPTTLLRSQLRAAMDVRRA